MAYGSSTWGQITPYDWLAATYKAKPASMFSWQVPTAEMISPRATSPYVTFSDLAAEKGWTPGRTILPGSSAGGVVWPSGSPGAMPGTPISGVAGAAPGGAVEAGGASPGNPFSSIRNVRIPAVQNILDQAVADWGTTRGAARNDLATYRDESATARARGRGFLDEENAAVGGYFNGGVQARLDKILADRTAANAAITNRFQAVVLGRDSQRGLAGLPKTYRNRTLDEELGRIYENEANARTAQEQQNLTWLEAAKQSMLGRRAAGETAYLDTALYPMRATQASDAAMAGLAGSLTQAQLANSLTGIYAPYQPSLYGAGYGGGYFGAPASYNFSPRMNDYGAGYPVAGATRTYPATGAVPYTPTSNIFPTGYGSLFPSNSQYANNPFSGPEPWPNYNNVSALSNTELLGPPVPDWLRNPASRRNIGVTRSWD